MAVNHDRHYFFASSTIIKHKKQKIYTSIISKKTWMFIC